MKQRKIITLSLLFSILLIVHYSSMGCTIVSCSLHGEVFAAANEDDFTPFSRIWFNPRTPDRFGSVCFGAPDMQVGAAMNEYGLFYDFTAQYGIDPAKFEIKHPYNGDVMFELLGKCKTVKEALAFLETHNYTAASQVLIADATGNSAILHVGVKVVKTGSYQINTNFDIANLATGNYSCGRYNISDNILSNAKSVSVSMLKNLLNQTHQEGDLSTQYSNIYDLKRGKIYVYLFHDFEHTYVIDLKKELKKGYRLEMLSDHFPASFAYQSFMEKHPIYKKEKIMVEIKENGLMKTIDKYLAEIKNTNTTKDSTLKNTLLDVGVQLIKDSHNQHQFGSMWEYFFGLQNGHNIIHYTDERLTAATELFNSLLQEQWNDIKLRNFILEMTSYINLLEHRNSESLIIYQYLAANPSETFPVTNSRSKEMVNRIKKLD